MSDPGPVPSIDTEEERRKLRQMAADHAAYEIAHGLRELLGAGVREMPWADEYRREGAQRLRGGICEALLFLAGDKS